MSKKKNKFKTNKRHHSPEQAPKAISPKTVIDSGTDSLILESSPEQNVDIAPDHYDTQKYDYVKHDIKKILIIMGSILIVLFAFYFIELKTTILDTTGNWIYKILNIQTL